MRPENVHGYTFPNALTSFAVEERSKDYFTVVILSLVVFIMRVSAAIQRDRPPGNPRATHGLSRGFVAKACPARGALERFCVFGKIPRGHTHGICT